MRKLAYNVTRTETLPLLGEHDRIEHAPNHAASVQRYTSYEDVADLFFNLELGSFIGRHLHEQRVIDPCAGDGSILRHMRKCGVVPAWMTLIDIVPSTELQKMAQADGPVVTVQNPADLFHDLAPDDRMSGVITNWPWYGWSNKWDHLRALYPNAAILGISCDQERRDGRGPDWFPSHRQTFTAHLRGRRTYPRPDRTTNGKYPLTCSWYIWGPGVTDDKNTRTVWL